MRSKIVGVSIVLLCLLFVGVAAAGEPVHRVSGGGKLALEDGYFETYGFAITMDADGAVKGHGSFLVHNSLIIQFEANCLAVEGNTAWFGGVVTRSSDPSAAPVGLDFTWQLQDNDQGNAAVPDLQSFVLPTDLLPVYGLGETCLDKGPLLALGAFEWQYGNILIR